MQCFKYKYKKSLYLHSAVRGGRVVPDPACQSKSPRFETKVVRDGQPYDTVRSVGPVRGGLGYRWLVTPEGLNHIHLGEAGWTIWEAIHAPFLSII